MVTRIKDGLSKFEAEREFVSTGDIGASANNSWKVGAENQLRIVLENVGATNSVTCKGRIRNQSTFQDLATIVGPTLGTTIDISLIDEVYFTCTVYDPSGVPKLVASGFFEKASSDTTTASNLGATGEGVFAQEVGDDLQFKKIAAGSGISVTANSTTITISAGDPVEVCSLVELATSSASFETIHSVVVPTDKTYRIRLHVVSRKADGTAHATFQRTGLYWNEAGTLSTLNALHSDLTLKTNNLFDVRYQTSGTTVNIQVRSINSDTGYWRGQVCLLEVSTV